MMMFWIGLVLFVLSFVMLVISIFINYRASIKIGKIGAKEMREKRKNNK